MAKDWEKFLKRQDKRKRTIIAKIIQDILEDNLSQYGCIPMEGMPEHRRIKYDNLRIIFYKTGDTIIIKKIWFRWDVYK